MPASQIGVKINEIKFVMAYLFGDRAYIREIEKRGNFGPKTVYTNSVISDDTVIAVLPSDEDCENCEMKEICEKMEKNPAYKSMLDGIEVGGLYTVARLKEKYQYGLGKMEMDTQLFKMAPLGVPPIG